MSNCKSVDRISARLAVSMFPTGRKPYGRQFASADGRYNGRSIYDYISVTANNLLYRLSRWSMIRISSDLTLVTIVLLLGVTVIDLMSSQTDSAIKSDFLPSVGSAQSNNVPAQSVSATCCVYSETQQMCVFFVFLVHEWGSVEILLNHSVSRRNMSL